MTTQFPPGLPERRSPRVDQSCATAWDGAPEPAWGSAAPARFWLAVEQPGPWGHRAMVESRMDRRVGAGLETACARAGGRALLIRTIGPHRREGKQGRRVFISGGMPQGRPWLLTGLVSDPAELLRLPFAGIPRNGDPEEILTRFPDLEATSTPVLLICTNAKRDMCCALRGRPLAAAAAQSRPEQVWECSHCGGHRFAPTGVVLPSGHTLGRLTPELCVTALDSAALDGDLAPVGLDPAHNRGLSHLAPPGQAADGYLRHLLGEKRVGVLSFTAGETQEIILAAHTDGRRWRLRVAKTTSGALRRTSCTTDPVASLWWQVTVLEESRA